MVKKVMVLVFVQRTEGKKVERRGKTGVLYVCLCFCVCVKRLIERVREKRRAIASKLGAYLRNKEDNLMMTE